MKRDPDFWVWLSVMAVFLTVFLMTWAYEANFFSSFFLALFFVVLVVATGYLGYTLLAGSGSKAVVASQAPTGVEQRAQRRRSKGRTIAAVCVLGMAVLTLLGSSGVLPRSPLIAIPYVALFGGWLWYELVGSKKDEVGR
ncbi:MAG: hypothetical protein QOH93_3466 [Chloroflexia bacterium]|jgi:hypothetical protein|nr:hypothetical protein [Chloroflexia bacterium]